MPERNGNKDWASSELDQHHAKNEMRAESRRGERPLRMAAQRVGQCSLAVSCGRQPKMPDKRCLSQLRSNDLDKILGRLTGRAFPVLMVRRRTGTRMVAAI